MKCSRGASDWGILRHQRFKIHLVRQDTVNPWAVNDVFTDEAGARRRVVGIRNAQQQAHVAGGLLELIGRT